MVLYSHSEINCVSDVWSLFVVKTLKGFKYKQSNGLDMQFFTRARCTVKIVISSYLTMHLKKLVFCRIVIFAIDEFI